MVPISEQSNLTGWYFRIYGSTARHIARLWSLMANVESMFHLFLYYRTAVGEILCFLYNADKKRIMFSNKIMNMSWFRIKHHELIWYLFALSERHREVGSQLLFYEHLRTLNLLSDCCIFPCFF